MPRFDFARLLWFVLLMGAFLVLGSEHSEAKEALASWYGPGFEGHPTANGEPYNPNGYTTAHKTLPFGTNLMVSYKGHSVPVRVNDRGPFTDGRELDLSQAAARDLGLIPVGVDYVEYDILGSPAPNSWPGAAQQPGPTQGAAQQPVPSQGATQQTNPSQGVAQQPNLAQGAAQQPEITQGATLQPDISQGVAQQPDLAQGAAQQPDFSQGAALRSDNNPGGYPAVQDGAGNGTYVVQPGDTLSQIAAGLGVTTDYLASRNGITDPNLIYSGQPLYYLVGNGEHETTGDMAMYGLVGDNAAVDEGAMQTGEGAIVTAPAPQNPEIWAPDQVVVPYGAGSGGGGYVLPATGA